MSNSDNGNELLMELLRAVAAEYNWPDLRPEERVLAQVNPQIYESYVGQYDWGRVERNNYDTVLSQDRRDRDLTGFSGSFGIRVPVWEGGTISANYAHNYRAPSLDELYNQGPHPGNFTFEVGDTNLKRERGDGVDVSFPQSYKKVRAEAHYFYYKRRRGVG